LQPADLIAYETFRYLHGRQQDVPHVRALIRAMFKQNGYLGFFFDADVFERLKQPLRDADVQDNGFLVTFPTPSDPDFEQIRKEIPENKWDDPRLD
jgi:predicted dienelactone hydrolase